MIYILQKLLKKNQNNNESYFLEEEWLGGKIYVTFILKFLNTPMGTCIIVYS